jgi:hypothetical protein
VSADELEKIFEFAQRIEIGANTMQELTLKPQTKAHTLGRKTDEIGREANQPR